MCLRLFSLLSTYLFVSLLTVTCAQMHEYPEVVSVGNYYIVRCSAILPSTRTNKSTLLTSLLREIDNDLPTLLVEANVGTDSDYGFTSLFTSNDAIEPVTAAYRKISDGATVVLPHGIGERKVTFVCLERDDPVTSHFVATLEGDEPRGAAYSPFGRETIYLLPFFFKEQQRSPKPYRCPVWRGQQIVVNGDDILSSTQYGVLIHELVHKYLHPNGLSQPERYILRDVTGDRWDEAGKVDNADNYSFFASSLKAGCTRWPK